VGATFSSLRLSFQFPRCSVFLMLPGPDCCSHTLSVGTLASRSAFHSGALVELLYLLSDSYGLDLGGLFFFAPCLIATVVWRAFS